MKAHEETWNADACCGFVKDVAGNIVADVSLLTTEKRMEETTQLISAAPDMARALRRMLDAFPPCGSEEEANACDEARAALKKAGVL